ncbi:hypothetical protein FRC11_013294 [Ceratobasidium sp. 423]|nr:hypothetical protein FRC11_013294 [Ceratobasidium sp. 423]
MALPMLMNGGADCGPSNALQGFSKQFDQDRGAAHDRLDTRPGPSSTFRTRPTGAAVNPLEQDAMRFFGPSSVVSAAPVAFDVAALRGALPVVAPAPAVVGASGWAADFARAGGSVGGGEWALQMQAQGGVQGTVQHPMAYTPMSMNMPFNHSWPAPALPMQTQSPESQIVFPDIQPQTTVEPTHAEPTPSTSSTEERSELAETARQLLNALQHETRPKFQNSQFMGLMKQLRDGEVVVQDGDMSVLEHEAIVQRDPTNAQAWFALGVKQQENEREQHAIDALREAVLQDPSCMPAYLALAVSYANEGDRASVHQAIGDWMAGRGAQVRKVGGLGELGVKEGVASVEEIHQEYISGLLNMARQSSNEIDADIQIALGVLLNTMEDYPKAQDCFRTALAVRPDDWLLFNRVGATLANSGSPEEAVPFYYKALELNPGYIRARYNLGISCINLRRYEEAAQHLVDALVLQESEGMNSERGVTSDSLWDTLRSTCLNLQRVDLAVTCEARDLQKFINGFHTEA